MNIAIIGATGLVGSTMLKVLEERKIKFDNLYLFASEKSKGKKVKAFGKEYEIIELNERTIEEYDIDVAFFAAGKEISTLYIPILKRHGTISIDNSSAYRMNEDIPLVVPEINMDDVKKDDKIIANPNCSTIQEVIALNPLKKFGIKRVVCSTYQAVSGAGYKGIEDLKNTLEGKENAKFTYKIANNCIPHIDDFTANGYTKEEIKIIEETRKILHDKSLRITATAVRVPVKNCHSESINVEFDTQVTTEDVIKEYENAKGLIVYDNVDELKYPLASIATNKDEVYVGRIRKDLSVESGVNIWVVADNVRKGAATNAVQILEGLIERKIINE